MQNSIAQLLQGCNFHICHDKSPSVVLSKISGNNLATSPAINKIITD